MFFFVVALAVATPGAAPVHTPATAAAADAAHNDAARARPRLAITGLRNDGVDKAVLRQVVDALALALSRDGRGEVLTATEVQAVLGLEAAKQAADCSGASSCAAMDEITKALDVRYLVAGSVAPRDGGVFVNVSLVDVNNGSVVARAGRDAVVDDLADDLAPVATQLLVSFGPPPPGAPTLARDPPVLAFVGIGVGTLGLLTAVTGAALWGVDHTTIADTQSSFTLKDEARGRYALDQVLVYAGVGVVGVGAALTGVGFVLESE